MKALNTILALTVLSACGHAHKVEIDPVLKPYVDDFIALSGAYRASPVELDDLVVEFGTPTKPTAIGECRTGPWKSPTVVIDPTWWNEEPMLKYYPEMRALTVYHELGHCLLQRGHREDVISDGQYVHPLSIMYPQAFPVGKRTPKDLYYSELFEVIDIAALKTMFAPYFGLGLTSIDFEQHEFNIVVGSRID